MLTYRTTIEAAWVDYNGHLRDAFYALVFSYATDALMDATGLDEAGRARTGHTLYTLEMHIGYVLETRLGERVEVRTQLLDRDAKRLHILHSLHRQDDGQLLAASEQLLMNIDTRAARASAFDPAVSAGIDRFFEGQGELAHLEHRGRRIGIRR